MNAVFLSILNMSLVGAYIIALVCIARRLLKKAPKAVSYMLWAVVGFRLVFPFTVESVFSLVPFSTSPISSNIATQPMPRVDSGIPMVNSAINSVSDYVLPAATHHYSVNPMQIWTTPGAWVWFVVAVAFAVYGIASCLMLKHRMKKASWVSANIYEADNIKSPFVLGILSPKIYLPVGLSAHERVYILLHEQTHIKRYDHIVKFVAYFILCLHWFNPLAWLAFWLMGADMEMSCDERVMRELGGDIAADYSMSLVRIAAGNRLALGSPLAFGEGGIKERVKRVLKFKKPSRVLVVLAVVVVAALSMGFALNRISQSDEERDTYQDIAGLIEMEILHVDDPATFMPLMQLRWDDAVYSDVSRYRTNSAWPEERGDEIGYAVCDFGSHWRVFERSGYGHEYLLIFERDNMDVFRLMHPHLPAVVGQFVLENATDEQRFTRMLSVTLYYDGTARLAIPPISSFGMWQTLYYTFADNWLIIHDGDNNTIARFEVIDSNTLAFWGAYVPLFADAGARYVATMDMSINTSAMEYTTIDTVDDTAEADSSVVHYIYLQEIAPDEAVPIARVWMGDGIVYEIEVEAQQGNRILVGLRPNVTNTITSHGQWYHMSVAPDNPRFTTIPLLNPFFVTNPINLNGFYYLFVGNNSGDEMMGVSVRVASINPQAQIELLTR